MTSLPETSEKPEKPDENGKPDGPRKADALMDAPNSERPEQPERPEQVAAAEAIEGAEAKPADGEAAERSPDTRPGDEPPSSGEQPSGKWWFRKGRAKGNLAGKKSADREPVKAKSVKAKPVKKKPKRKPLDPRRKARLAKTLRFGAAVVVIALLCAVPSQTDVYTTYLATQALVFGLLAVGVGVLTGHAGMPTMGQVAPYAVGAYTTAWLTRHDITNGLAQLAVAALAGALFCAITGPVVIRARGVVVIMLTLAVGELTATAATQWKSFTGGTDGLAGIPATRVLPGTPELLNEDQVYVYVLVVTAVVSLATALVLRSPAGLLLAGCRENEARMRAAGHPVDRYLLTAYIGAGAIGGIGGALLITHQRYVSPGDVGFDVSALALLAVVIGGVRSITGALAGAALIVFARDWLGGWWPGHAPLFLGVLFLVAVYVLPDGAAGFAGRTLEFGRRFRERKPAGAGAKSEAV